MFLVQRSRCFPNFSPTGLNETVSSKLKKGFKSHLITLSLQRTFGIAPCNPRAVPFHELVDSFLNPFPAVPDRNSRRLSQVWHFPPPVWLTSVLMFSRLVIHTLVSFVHRGEISPESGLSCVGRKTRPEAACLPPTLRLAHQLGWAQWNHTQTGETHKYQMYRNW